MYGLINNSLRAMVLDKFGEQTWLTITAAAGLEETAFLTMRSYDDSITYALVAAASETLNAPAETCLEMFGEFWVLEVASKSYALLMEAAGNDMISFLHNINSLHDRITSTFLEYRPPHFLVEDIGEAVYRVHYSSERTGLSPFVTGLLKGLGSYFNTPVTIINQTSHPVENGEKTTFDIRLSQQ